jgi:probable phosphoglycerate mutase
MRHFPTDWNRAGRLQGRVDRPLTAEARAALGGLAAPAPWDRARALASPLSRAVETARALWRDVETDPRLVEIDWGRWEGLRPADLLADPASGFTPMERWGWTRRPPGGESPADAWTRVRPLLAEIAAAAAPTVIVAHRGLIRVILARAHGWDFDRPEPFAIKRARLSPLRLDPEGVPRDPGPTVRLAAR